ncbi:hypothetical protein B0H14DRAFT_3431154 [Mycena olivaceomarginata]|nr:hypothetical protein B0H14DRAFT_3431154 [Mycena olivaceomarginata]
MFHSFVRPNDRGKEVLSSVVCVDPGNNKEGWKIEKMYSDVLVLDQRMRNSVGKKGSGWKPPEQHIRTSPAHSMYKITAAVQSSSGVHPFTRADVLGAAYLSFVASPISGVNELWQVAAALNPRDNLLQANTPPPA